MALDANIILQGRGIQLENPLEMASRAMTLKHLGQQTKLADQEMAERQGIKDAYSKNLVTGPDGQVSINQKAALSDLYKASPLKAEEVKKAWAAAEDEARHKNTKIARELAWSVNDPQSYQAMLVRYKELGLPNADKLPAQYEPEWVRGWQMRTLEASEQLAQMNKDKDREVERQKAYSQAADRSEARAQRAFEAGQKYDEKMQALKTPFGLANTVDDAKQLKDAFESKKTFDSKLEEMIQLREKYGAEYLNRDAVARGRQLSKDLLLEYKNMAKLGVLSKADEDIINAIIPADPLAQDWAPGQDPILSNLTKFKADSDKDFQTRVGTRTRAGIDTVADQPKYEPDVLAYAEKYGISPDAAKQIKAQRTQPQSAGR